MPGPFLPADQYFRDRESGSSLLIESTDTIYDSGISLNSFPSLGYVM